MSGQFQEGDPVNIDRLGRELSVSSTPVREALHILRGEGFVQFEARRGFRIAPLRRTDVEDLFLVQAQLAGELAARAAERISSQDLGAVNTLQERMLQASQHPDRDEVENLNFEFHRVINRSAESPKLAWLLSVVVRYVPRRFYSMIPGWPEATLRDHDSVIKALNNRDPQQARVAMMSHIQHAGELLMAHLEDRGFWNKGNIRDETE